MWINKKLETDSGSPDSQANDLLLLIARYYNATYGWLYKRLNNHHDTEDVINETILKTIKYLERFNGENFKSWFFKIASNELKTHFRCVWARWKTVDAKQLENTFAKQIKIALDPEPEESLDYKQIRLVMKFLPPQQRMALEDHYVNEQPDSIVIKTLGLKKRETFFEYKNLGIKNARRLWEMIKESLEPNEIPNEKMRFFNISEIAKMYNCTTETIRKEVLKKRLRTVIYGREYKVRKEWLKEWAKTNKDWLANKGKGNVGIKRV